MKKNPLEFAKNELARRTANGVAEAIKNAPENARKAWEQWRKKRESRK